MVLYAQGPPVSLRRASTEEPNLGGYCAGKLRAGLKLVHVPKTGGMSVVCTFNSMGSSEVRGFRTYGASQGCAEVQVTWRMPEW